MCLHANLRADRLLTLSSPLYDVLQLASGSTDSDTTGDLEESKGTNDGMPTKLPLTFKNIRKRYLENEKRFINRLSYAENLQRENKSNLLGDATVLVVYSENCLLEVLVKALERYCDESNLPQDSTFFWLKDLACRREETEGRMDGA